MSYLLEVDPLDLGPGVKAVGLELIERESREPLPTEEAAPLWAAAIPALAGEEPWALDFFAHLDRVRDFCRRRGIEWREAAPRAMVVAPPPKPEDLRALVERFAGETFGIRAGGNLPQADAELEGHLARRGVDAYHTTYTRYYLCGVCDLENGFLTLLTNRLWASEVVRRLGKALGPLEVDVRLTQQIM